MKTVVSILLISAFFLACSGKGSSTNAACGVDNPIKDLAWLKAYVDETEDSSQELSKYFYVLKGIYNEETVFIFDNCCPFCNTIVPVYDCEGKSLGFLNDKVNRSEIKHTEIIYQPDNFACSTD